MALQEIAAVQSVNYQDNIVSATVDRRRENLGDMIDAILSAGYKLRGMTSREASLETVFLNLTGKSLRD